jgi:hypothetical protein
MNPFDWAQQEVSLSGTNYIYIIARSHSHAHEGYRNGSMVVVASLIQLIVEQKIL